MGSWNKKKSRFAFFTLWVISSVTMLLLVCSDAAMATTVGTSTASNATEEVFQRKSFFANSRFWVFYFDGTNMVFKTSTIGSIWSSETAVRSCTHGNDFSIWFDGTYVHYAYSPFGSPNQPINYRRGLPNSDGTITWTDERIAVPAASSVQYRSPFIAVDSNGYPWIGYLRYVSRFTANPYVTKASTNDGTWTTETGFPRRLSRIDHELWRVSVVPLTEGKVYAIYLCIERANTVRGRLWNGSWGAEEAASTRRPYLGPNHSALAHGDDVHIVYQTASPYHIMYRKRTDGVGWGEEQTVQSVTTSTTGPTLSIDPASGNLFCFWAGSPTANHIYYKKNVGGAWDTNPTDLKDESADGLTGNDKLTSFYRASSTIGLMYMVGRASPYDIRITGVQPTAVELEWAQARYKNKRVQLEWKTGYEVSNLGFHVYREEGGELYRLTPELIAGSALLAGSGTYLTAGWSYAWWDFLPEGLGSVRYWLVDVDLSGERILHGPITPVLSHEPLTQKVTPKFLSELGLRLEDRYRTYWKAQELRGKFALKRLEAKGAGTSLPQGATLLPSSIEASASNLPSGIKGEYSTGRVLYEWSGPSSLRQEADPQLYAMQWDLANEPAVKLLVKEEGWYRVTQPELVAAGLDPGVDPQYLQLFMGGEEQPIRVKGEGDSYFDPQDAIEFYGVGFDTPYTDTQVYWLIAGTMHGKRIEAFEGGGGKPAPSSFWYTVEKEEKVIYFAALKNGEEDNFFGPIIAEEPVDQLLNVVHIDFSSKKNALLEVSLQGVTNTPHRIKILLNDVKVGEVVFAGQSRKAEEFTVPQSMLLEGDNLVTFEGQEGEEDVSLVDYIRLTYQHTYTADNDVLKCTAKGGKKLTIDGFSSPEITVADITDLKAVLTIEGKVEPQGSGYSVTFEVPGKGSRTLLAFIEEEVKVPAGITANNPSSWHQTENGYDFVIISHRDFLEELQSLKDLRESQGLSVALIDVKDLYDEFNFGVKSPYVLHDFLALAQEKWTKAPRFVLLVGDASFDTRNYLGLGEFDLLPTKNVDTESLETASDDWFVDFDEDGLPDMAIGRLPVRTVEDAERVVSKIIGYEQSAEMMDEALLVADRVDTQGFDFEAASREVGALLPVDIGIIEIFKGSFGSDAEAKVELLSSINQGPLLVNFIGHGSVEIWKGSILTSKDAGDLTNGIRLPFFISMTCLNGLFHDLYTESLAEALLKAEHGGAVAVWASSGLTEPAPQTVMNIELIKLLFNGEGLTIGEVTARAKASVDDEDVRRTWILFGDPTTKLKY